MRNPNWSRDELILAFELYMRDPKSPPGKASFEVQQLSRTLNALGKMLAVQGENSYRNVNGVYMKVMNFRRFDPEMISAGKVGLSRGNRDEKLVWDEFSNDLLRLRQTAESILSLVNSAQNRPDPLMEFDVEEAEEGRLLTVTHLCRERNRKFVQAKKISVLKETGELRCEACDLNFSERYGTHGEGFIEVHHIQPLHTLLAGQKTNVKDLALVCSNCHRMIHRRRPWLSVEAVRGLVAKTFPQVTVCNRETRRRASGD